MPFFSKRTSRGRVPALPAICLIVSGGHTLLYHVQSANENGGAPARGFHFRRLGGTRDDAAGEAYDKVARLLALGYPGGPIIDQIATKVAASGTDFSPREKDELKFGPVKIRGNAHDFSFSGIKTAVLYYVRAHPEFAPKKSKPAKKPCSKACEKPPN